MDNQEEKKLILLIDDIEFYLTSAELILKDKYRTITAKSGQEAITHLLQGIVPDLILLDIIMPKMDGWQTYNKLRGISLLQDVPIAFVTSVHGTADMKYAFKIGAADYITKPYEKNDFLNRIEKIISKNKTQEQ